MIQNLNHLVDYIETHIADDIDIASVAKQVGISEYHLKRTFSFLAGVSLSEYIKARRLALANIDLIAGMSVTDVAFKYRYQSVDGFSRAFRDWSGYVPSEISKNHMQKTYPKLSFFIDVKGGNPMEFKIENKPAFNLVGISKTVTLQFEGENADITALAQSITPEQRAEMHELADMAPNRVMNASHQFENQTREGSQLMHMIGMPTLKANPFPDLETLAIPALTWAIFPNKGPFPATLQSTMARIFNEWLPSSDYELVDAPELSFTHYEDLPGDAYSEIWVAVRPRK